MVEDNNLTTVKVDQGSLGHPTTKPTTLLTDLDEIKGVDGWKMQGQPGKWPQELEKRTQFSKELATWATGLKGLLKMAIQRLSQQETMVKALTLKEQKEIMEWKEHFCADHLPFRKDCEVCLRAAGADRYRKRLQCPTSFCLSLDIMGPFVQGKDQELKGPRYGLVATYTVPIDKHGAPLPQGLAGLHLPHQQGRDVDDDFMHEDPEVLPQDAVLEQLPEVDEEPQQELTEAEIKQQEVRERRRRDFLQDRKSQAVKNLTFAVPLKSRHHDDLLQAVAQIYVKTKAMALPVQRVHTDRAKEFVGKGFQKWIRDHDLFHTMSSGSEQNARVEREVRELKQRMRTVLTASRAPTHFWPLALRHVGEQRLRRQLQALGVTTPELLPFGMNAMVKQKLWQKRDDTLKYPMQKVRLWGPAADMATTSLGYYVQSDETGKFFRSTVVKVFADQPTLQAERGDAPRGEEEGLGDQHDPGDEENCRLDDDQQGPQQPGEAHQAQAADDLQARDHEVQGIFDDEIEEAPQQERRRIDMTKAKKGLSFYPHLEINAVLEELRNHPNKQSGGDYMVKGLKCDLITPGSSRSMQPVEIKFDFLGMKNIVEHNVKKQLSV